MISDVSPVNNYSGNNTSTSFDFDFYIEDTSQLKVYYINSLGEFTQLTQDVDYSVNEFTPDPSRATPDFSEGGYIVFPLTSSSYSVLASDEKISLQLDIPFSQESEYGNSSLLNLSNLEFSLDYLTRLTQILKRQVERCAKIKEGASVNPETLSENINLLAQIQDDISTVSGAISDVIIASDNTEDISTVAGSIGNVNNVANSLSDISAVKDDLTNIDSVAGDLTNIDTVASNISNINAVKNNETNINAVNSNKTNIDAVASDLTNIDSVASNISDINAVEDKLTEIEAVADDLTNIVSVASDLTNINAVAGDLTNIDAVASDLTNIDSVAGDLTNIDSVASNISDINAVEDKLTEIENVAGDLTNIDAVAGDLTNIDLVAGDLTNIDNASSYADNANIWAEGTDEEVQELGGVHSAKGWANESASGQIQSDWNQTDNTAKDYIKNKPTIPAAGANTDLSNLTATGEAHFQKPLNAGNGIIIEEKESNGSSWETATQNGNLGANNWKCVAYNGTNFVAISQTGYISTSTDGINWDSATQNSDLGNNYWSSLIYDGTRFIALGASGHISTSSNGTTWTTATQVSNLGNNTWASLAYNGSIYVALGLYGHISTSSDGTTWTAAVQNANLGNNAWYAISYDGTKFLALGQAGHISTSTDGTTWTTASQISNLGNNAWRCLFYNNVNFVALGRTGYISTSTDGTTWTVAVQNTNLGNNYWLGLGYGNNSFIALGRYGYIALSEKETVISSSTDVQINGTSITSQGVANILTNSAYNASSNKIATMSDLPDDEIFIATYGTTTYNEVLTAYNAGKTVFAKYDNEILPLIITPNGTYTSFMFGGVKRSTTNSMIYYDNYSLNETYGWSAQISVNPLQPYSSNIEYITNKVTSISSSSTNDEYTSAKCVWDNCLHSVTYNSTNQSLTIS